MDLNGSDGLFEPLGLYLRRYFSYQVIVGLGKVAAASSAPEFHEHPSDGRSRSTQILGRNGFWTRGPARRLTLFFPFILSPLLILVYLCLCFYCCFLGWLPTLHPAHMLL